MRKNYMTEIAEVLGLEIGDTLLVEEMNTMFKMRREGLKCLNDENFRDTECAIVLRDILAGKLSMKKLPWKPIDMESYFYVYKVEEKKVVICEKLWENDVHDYIMYASKNVFKNKESAEESASLILEHYKSLYDAK